MGRAGVGGGVGGSKVPSGTKFKTKSGCLLLLLLQQSVRAGGSCLGEASRLALLTSVGWLGLLLVGWGEGAAVGFEGRPLYRGLRAQAMGNAFTAVADDEQAIFFNPAGLAGQTKISLQLAALQLELSGDALSSGTSLAAVANQSGLTTLNALMGKNLFLRAQGNAEILLPGFGFSVIGSEEIALRLQNPASPALTVGLQTTYGGQAAWGFQVLKFRKKKGGLRLGVALKMLWRAGGYTTPSLTDLMTFQVSSIYSKASIFGRGYGADAGAQLVYRLSKKVQLSGALAYTDIGMTSFLSGGGAPIASNLVAGLALKLETQDVSTLFSFDYGHVFESLDYRNKLHFGWEVQLPVVSFFAGLNQLLPSYGVMVHLALFRVGYLSYAEQLGALNGVSTERRSLAYTSLQFDF